MPLPLAPVAVFALRAGVVATALWLARRALAPQQGRTDQRAEDALDDLDDGIAAHTPADRPGQRNLAARMRRAIRWKDGGIAVDASLVARWRITRTGGTGQGAEASGGNI